jgi:hypothetical protein
MVECGRIRVVEESRWTYRSGEEVGRVSQVKE